MGIVSISISQFVDFILSRDFLLTTTGEYRWQSPSQQDVEETPRTTEPTTLVATSPSSSTGSSSSANYKYRASHHSQNDMVTVTGRMSATTLDDPKTTSTTSGAYEPPYATTGFDGDFTGN